MEDARITFLPTSTPHGKIEAGGLEQLLKFVQGK
jgi:hypothetical protein